MLHWTEMGYFVKVQSCYYIPAGIFLFKVNNENTRTMCEILYSNECNRNRIHNQLVRKRTLNQT